MVLAKLCALRSSLAERFPWALVSFADLSVVDMDRYERLRGRRQRVPNSVVNARIEELNRLLIEENQRPHVFYSRTGASAFLNQAIVRLRRVRSGGRYVWSRRPQWSYLVDGLHVSRECLRRWVKTFINCFDIDRRTVLDTIQ